MAVSWSSLFRFSLLFLLLAAIVTAFVTLPMEKILKDFLVWIQDNLGPWGPLGGGYLFGLPLGFVADSLGGTFGATAAFLLGRTIGRPYVISKLKDYPKFQAVAIAIQRSGFKIVLLLRLVPLLPFNMLNYLLSVTPVGIWEYIMASWLGMMPITLALVYVGTTLKDLTDVTHGWNKISASRWVLIISGFVVSAILMVCVTKVAKSSLEKALAENPDVENLLVSPQLPITSCPSVDLHKPLIIKVDPSNDDHENIKEFSNDSFCLERLFMDVNMHLITKFAFMNCCQLLPLVVARNPLNHFT
ncbi:hypothetical protein IEQ34_000201 [Dendrobium chrysotoxum]|uniref:VTT domain-containing protein n=1 Tax=Dendrobium chrysotoxum TaxID=161865 RepID=A0AAV7HSH2_DENCH|nr:hypothetical protein IEQ34_000201 [Dendrobium chrysotoxum]